MCHRHSKLDKLLSVVVVSLVVLGAGFILYSTQATCESALAPAHAMCTD